MVVSLVSCCQYQNRACPTSAVHAELFLFPVVGGLRLWDRMCFPFLSVTVLLLLCEWMLFQDQEWNLGFPPLRWLLFVKDERLKGSLCLRLLHISTVFTFFYLFFFLVMKDQRGTPISFWRLCSGSALKRAHQTSSEKSSRILLNLSPVLLSLNNLTLSCLLRSCSVLYLLQFHNQKIIWGLACKLQNKPGSDWGTHKQYFVGILAELLWLFIIP